MPNKAVERLIAVNRQLVEILHRRGLIPVGGAQILKNDLADAARNIEQAAVASANRAVADVKQSANRAVADVKKAVAKEKKQLTAKVKAAIKPKKAAKPAAKKPAAKKVVAKKAAKPAKKAAPKKKSKK